MSLLPNTHRDADADAAQLSSFVASAVCTEFATIGGDGLDESEEMCRQRVANCVHTADADATQLDSCVPSVVCIVRTTCQS